MSKRVLLGKIDGSDYGLLVSRAGVDVTTAYVFDSMWYATSCGVHLRGTFRTGQGAS